MARHVVFEEGEFESAPVERHSATDLLNFDKDNGDDTSDNDDKPEDHSYYNKPRWKAYLFCLLLLVFALVAARFLKADL